jgi:type VI secretion system protein ImpK
MGYRGRYALGDSGELHQLLRQALAKIERVRGPASLMPPIVAPAVPPARTSDPWTRTLLITTCVLAGLAIIAFGGYEITLGSGVTQVENAGISSR